MGNGANRMLRMVVVLLVALSLAAPRAHGSDAGRFTSPGGRYEVTFEELAHREFSESARQSDFDRINHVRYRISFHDNSRPGQTVTVEYTDVYGSEANAKPTPPANLFRGILWSPKEDFAVLDEEGWARAPGAPERLAVALSAELPWRTAPFWLHEPVWVDSFRAVANIHDDCEYSVGLFDGKTGQTKMLGEARSPMGYEFLGMVGGSALIRTVLDNCKTEEAEKAFVPECISVSLDSMQATPVACGSLR